MGPGGMDADRIREIMGEAPACPRKGRGTSGNDIMRPARKSGPMQPSVYGEEYLHGIAGVQRRSLHIPAALHRKLSILAGASRNGTVTLEGFINHLVSRHLEEYRETVEMILVVSTIPSAYTYSSCCCSVFCDFMFREANLKRDKNGTKPQENKVRNTIELHAPTVGITLSCTKVQICPVKSEQFYLFLSLTNTFSDYCTTRDNTSTFYILVYPFSEYVYVKQCFHSFGQ